MQNLAVRGATKSYRSEKEDHLILNELNLTIDAGSIYTLVGPSGCGKTTLISSILGMVKLDGGEIFMFGRKTDENVRYKFGTQIGYMPQEIALIGELTVKETIYFFGLLYQMKREALRNRYRMIRNLLDLPADDLRLEKCSGGQTRRVSFACAIIHDPKLLILDEPTVGLDVILREQIWKFMLDITVNEKKSILITTHYIEEALHSHRLGLMRHGRIILEDSPRAVVSHYDTESLEEAVYKVYQDNASSKLTEQSTELENERIVNNIETRGKNENKSSSYGWKMTSAILKKHISIYKRQPSGIAFSFLSPFMICFLLHIAIGRNPKDLTMGILNYETLNCSKTTAWIEDKCPHEDLSCLLLSEIHTNVFKGIPYQSKDKAYADAKKTKIFGFVEIGLNFSANFVGEELMAASDDMAVTRAIHNSSAIEIHMDETDMIKSLFIKREMYSAFLRFTQKFAQSCNISKSSFESPLNTGETLNGKLGDEQTPSMLVGTTIQNAYFATCGLMILIILSDRKEGLWNRTLLAGVKVKYIMISQFIFVTIVNIIQNIEYIVISYYLDMIAADRMIPYFIILSYFSLSGAFLGVVVALIFEDYLFANSAVMFFSMVTTSLAGVIWPYEAFDESLKIFASFMSFALPTKAVTNIMFKSMSILNPEVFKGLLVISLWSITSLVLGARMLNKKIFSRNT